MGKRQERRRKQRQNPGGPQQQQPQQQQPQQKKATVPATRSIPAAPPADADAAKAVIAKLAAVRQRPTIVYWTTPQARISSAVLDPLYDVLQTLGKQKALDVLLHTGGGDTEAPARIISLLREYSDDLALLVPHSAMSSGTLLAMGANEIVMTPLASLGPIDPSRRHPLLPRREGAEEPEPISVQDMRHAMQFIREAPGGTGKDVEATDYTPEAWAQIFEALFNKIHPLAIGAIEQSYALAKRVGKLCLKTHMTNEKKIDEIVNQLTDDYKSHAYRISRVEARDIGLNVIDADAATHAAMMEVFKFYAQRPAGPFGPSLTKGSNVKLCIAWLDSAALGFRVEGQFEVGDNQELITRGDQWVRYY